ncbi:MAG: hydrogenase formation protein HypD, partial [Candidatus Thorarchaeota archaeon]
MSKQTGFSDARYAQAVVKEIASLNEGIETRIVHVCGTHEDTIVQHGIRSLLPQSIKLVAGPGCPVCVCAAEDVDKAIELARQGHIITTFGDMIRVPSTNSSLAKERTSG